MLELFDRYVDWKVLCCFLACPTTLFYPSQIARQLQISPSSAGNTVKSFEDKGLVVSEEKGFARLYRLNRDNEVVKSLKRAYGIDLVLRAGPAEIVQEADHQALSLALYGSYASGTFDEQSDVDFLVVTPSKKELYVQPIRKLEARLDREVNFAIFKLSEWRKLAREGDAFYMNVVANNVLLYGAGLK